VDSKDPTLVPLPANLGWLEDRAIDAALAATSGNRTRAAALFGIHRMTLVKKLRRRILARMNRGSASRDPSVGMLPATVRGHSPVCPGQPDAR
jgi:hypothetical protein